MNKSDKIFVTGHGDMIGGALEPSSEPYAIAKIAGASLCESYRRQYGANFISAIPGDNYGPEDDFNPETAHVVPALIRKCHEAKVGQLPHVTAYGSGTPKRELLYADDLADACLFLMRRYDEPGPINIGCGAALTIRDLCGLIRDVVGYEGDILFDTTMPDGAPAKYLDTSRINGLGWRAATSFEDGIRATYRWYVENLEAAL